MKRLGAQIATRRPTGTGTAPVHTGPGGGGGGAAARARDIFSRRRPCLAAGGGLWQGLVGSLGEVRGCWKTAHGMLPGIGEPVAHPQPGALRKSWQRNPRRLRAAN